MLSFSFLNSFLGNSVAGMPAGAYGIPIPSKCFPSHDSYR